MRSATSSAPPASRTQMSSDPRSTTSSSRNANGSSCASGPAARMRAASDERSQAATSPSTSARSSGAELSAGALDAEGDGTMQRVAEARAPQGTLGSGGRTQADDALGVVGEATALVQGERAVGERARHVQRKGGEGRQRLGRCGPAQRRSRDRSDVEQAELTGGRELRLLGGRGRGDAVGLDLVCRVDVHAHGRAADVGVGHARLELPLRRCRAGRARAAARRARPPSQPPSSSRSRARVHATYATRSLSCLVGLLAGLGEARVDRALDRLARARRADAARAAPSRPDRDRCRSPPERRATGRARRRRGTRGPWRRGSSSARPPPHRRRAGRRPR